jgi:hypothetical protein
VGATFLLRPAPRFCSALYRQTIVTPAALEAIEAAGQTPDELFQRHQCGDWGDADDAAAHEFSLAEGFRIMSVYMLTNGVKVWVITEADRSVSTIFCLMITERA